MNRGGAAAAALWAACLCSPAATAQNRIEARFSPVDDVAGLIVGHVDGARSVVRMQAYLFTDRRIAKALLAARRRGVAVEIVGDAQQAANGGLPHLKALERAGARVWLDGEHAAAHDKVIVVDDAVVLTGSYNFTAAAQSKNAENVVALSGDAALAARFVQNFAFHRAHSTPWPSTSPR